MKDIQLQIDNLGSGKYWWYQPIKFNNLYKTHSRKVSDDVFYGRRTFGINKWNNYVKPHLPFGLKDKVVLDVGCNAGLFLIQSIKDGAKFAYGIEPSDDNQFDNGFDKQAKLVIDIFSHLDGVDYSKKIKVINKPLDQVDFSKDITHKIDITLCLNVLYWLTFSDEKGSLPTPEIVLQNCLDEIAAHSDYTLIVGDECVQRERRAAGLNSLGCGIDSTTPFLSNYEILTKYIEPNPPERCPSIMACRSTQSKNE